MLDSLSVLLAIIAFLAFGYLSVVRLLYKLPLNDSWRVSFQSLLQNYESNIRMLGVGVLAMVLPATSLLLFWGWGPALLWLVIFHLLFETVIHLRAAADPDQIQVYTSLHNKDTDFASLAKVPPYIWQLLMILLCSVLLTQLAKMLDQHSGLAWALLFLIPTSTILNTSNQAIPKTVSQLCAAVVLCFGLIIANSLGIAVYGSWTPFGFQLDWLVLNNASMSALGLLIATYLLTKKHGFGHNLSSLAGYLIISFLLILIFAIITLRPELDAPIQSISHRNTPLPLIFTVCLILFGSVLALLLRLVIHSKGESPIPAPGQFARLQSLAFLQLIFAVILVISLAAAMGIGAWNTHYADWSWSADLLRHFELGLSSIFNLAANQSDVGSMAHTLFMAGSAIILLSLLLFSIKYIALDSEQPQSAKTFSSFIVQSKVIHLITVFLLSCYFLSNGISLTTWAAIGLFSWFTLSHHLLVTANYTVPDENLQGRYFQRIYSLVCISIVVLGWVQLISLIIFWFDIGSLLPAIMGITLFGISVALWLPRIKLLLPHFQSVKGPALFK